MTLQRLTRISLLAALCVALRQAFALSKCPTYFCHLFLLVIFEGYSFAFLVMMITMFVSAFSWGWAWLCSFRLSPLAVWCSFGASVTSGCPLSFRSFLWAYCPLLMGSWSIVFMPWYTIFLGGPMLWSMVLVLTLPMLCRRSFSIPLSIKSLGDFMLKKTISSLMTLLAALLLASCAPSHSTNNQTTASSTEVAKKNEIRLQLAWRQEGSKSAIENLERWQKRVTSWKCSKPTTRLKKKMAWSPRLTVTAKMKPKVFTGCTRSMAKWLQKVLTETTVKKETRSNSIKKCINNEELDSVSGFRLKIKLS